MHRKHIRRWPKFISMASALAVLFGGLVVQSVQAVSSNPTPVCVGSTCTVTFQYSGDYYLWSPPAGAKNLTFDLAGGQGGRSGGQGGRITGSLVNPPAALYIYVGGSGTQGSAAAGGFNGGGAAGSGRGDEGSGGGATDIRTSTALADRIAIAAGGGGSGGFSGGIGGAGGGLTGSAGTSGQGQGGAGATQSAGGAGGYPNGGTWGSTGSSGVGGSGGASAVSGGGGGGGGYFGGGGGGADVDTCCSNAGGGGGGSSFASSTLTASVSHTSGYRAGAGIAIISYSMPPTVANFTSNTQLTNSAEIGFPLSFSESVTDLTAADFTLIGTSSCQNVAVAGSGSNYTVTASGCSVGSLQLTLAEQSVVGALAGPVSATSSPEVVIERTPAIAEFSAPASRVNLQVLNYNLAFSESVSNLDSSDFNLSGAGCAVTSIAGSGSSYAIEVTGCQNAQTVELELASESVTDLAGNLSPASPHVATSVQIDRSAPEAIWQAVPEQTFTDPVFQLNFDAAVDGVTVADFEVIAGEGCGLALAEIVPGQNFELATSGCALGDVQIQIAQGAYQDDLGNLGPVDAVASGLVELAAVPVVVAPTPTPTPTPTLNPTPAPDEATNPMPVESSDPGPSPSPVAQVSPISDSESTAVLEVGSGATNAALVETWIAEVLQPEPVANSAEAPLGGDGSEAIAAAAPAERINGESVPDLAMDFEAAQGILWAILGVVAAALVAVVVIRSARQLRQRRLLRLFS